MAEVIRMSGQRARAAAPQRASCADAHRTAHGKSVHVQALRVQQRYLGSVWS